MFINTGSSNKRRGTFTGPGNRCIAICHGFKHVHIQPNKCVDDSYHKI